MRLAQRLLLGALLIVAIVVAVAVALSGERLRNRLRTLTEGQLGREARLVSLQWRGNQNPDALADSAGAALGHRVTLVDSSGNVLGDSEFGIDAIRVLQNHNNRPEIIDARKSGIGSSRRVSPSEGIEEMYVAVAGPQGRIARVAINTSEVDTIVASAQSDVLLSGVGALLIAVALAAFFARQITKPIAELGDVAGAIARGDLSRRPALSAPGEVGDLAGAIQLMSEQLDSRLQALQQEDELLGALVESLNEGVVAVDRQRQVIRINRSGRSLLDVTTPPPFSVDLLPRDRVLQDALAEALAGGFVDRVETQIGTRTLALTARPLGDRGAVLALFDLTGIRKLEAVRRDFVANVSHELKTPLTAIRGYAETLASEVKSDPQHSKFAETIRANAERMQRLIDDLLDLSKIESGGWTPTPVIVDVKSAANEAGAAYRDEATTRGSTIRVDVASDASTVRADPTAIRQALGNLVENAVRYTPSGGTVTIFARAEDHSIVIGVKDTGSGIPGDHLPRVFERFYRVDPARSRAAGGTGLGLAIVKHLVEAHGGRVSAESAPGHGTIVSLFFPAGT